MYIIEYNMLFSSRKINEKNLYEYEIDKNDSIFSCNTMKIRVKILEEACLKINTI
jgi:hypothetical protein